MDILNVYTVLVMLLAISVLTECQNQRTFGKLRNPQHLAAKDDDVEFSRFSDRFSRRMGIQARDLDIPEVREYFRRNIKGKDEDSDDDDLSRTTVDPLTTNNQAIARVTADLGSILCATCQQLRNYPCIRRYCFAW